MENMKELADFYTERFKEDISALNIKTPHHLPKASEHIVEDIEMIKTLESKGFTYETEDGLYFDTSKDAHYGQLGKLGQETESRVENSAKKNSRDFALWKKNSNLGYPSPWGQGFPGWHIECSAMSIKYLGATFDIHTGGLDLAPVHHNNEIAQSESACGCQFVRFWLHNEFVNVPEGKMAKSEGTGVTLKILTEKGFSPLAYRYFLLMAHYRTPVTFSWEALEAAQNAFVRMKRLVDSWPDGGKVNEAYKAMFVEKIENDLNTPQALAVLWTLAKDKKLQDKDTTIKKPPLRISAEFSGWGYKKSCATWWRNWIAAGASGAFRFSSLFLLQ
jgi:cysteinyl-tRNA synthetase